MTRHLFALLLLASLVLSGLADGKDETRLRAKGPAQEYSANDLNGRAYDLLANGQTEDAVRVCEANVRLYPEDSNVYDSLAEGYMNAGKTDLAISNYKKSLELNPKNTNGVEMLGKLGVAWRSDGGSP